MKKIAKRIPARHLATLLLLAVLLSPGGAHAQAQLFNNGNIYAVQNGPTAETIIAITVPTTITRIMTYHWNNGQGTAAPGTIGLESSSGEMLGPWQAAGAPGQGGVPNAYWIATPNLTIQPGQYRVVDSDIATWSQNNGSGGAGMVILHGLTR